MENRGDFPFEKKGGLVFCTFSIEKLCVSFSGVAFLRRMVYNIEVVLLRQQFAALGRKAEFPVLRVPCNVAP